MSFALATLVAVVAQGVADPATTPLARKLICIDHVDYKSTPRERTVMVRWRSALHLERLEQVWLYVDGEVLFAVQIRDFGSIECRAKLASERLAAFKADVARTEFWRIRASRHASGPNIEGLSLHLDANRRCDFEMTAAQWAKSPLTPPIQASIDRLMVDVCGGLCPEPKERKP